MKRVAIIQSNYIPWKGYFDIIASVDNFVLYDTVQFTKNDWRNRNKIKTPQGVQWLTVPVGQSINRRICDVVLSDSHWQVRHWKTLESNYRRALHFLEIAQLISPVYLQRYHGTLSSLNRELIFLVCEYLGIETKIINSSDFELQGGQNERLLNICFQLGATEYISGPSAKGYLNEQIFNKNGIKVRWFDYSKYPEYPQLWGEFIHEVTILDLLFNCGPYSKKYMKFKR